MLSLAKSASPIISSEILSSDISSPAAFGFVSLTRRPESVQIYCLRQWTQRAEHGGKALNHGVAWCRNLSLLEGDDRKGCKGFEQLAGAKQEIGIARPTEAFVAAREGLVDQHSARRESAGNHREQRTVQVIGNDDSIIVIAELPTVVGLQVDPAHLAIRPRPRRQCPGRAVDRP